MTFRSFDTRSAAVAFAKQVSKANKTTVRILEREGIYFVEGEYFSSDETSIPDISEITIHPISTDIDYASWIKERGVKKIENTVEQLRQAYQASKQIETVTTANAMLMDVKEITPSNNLILDISSEKKPHLKSKKSYSVAGNSISEALKSAYISIGLPLAKHITGKAITSTNKVRSASSIKQKKQKKIPIKERGLRSLNRNLIKAATDQEIGNRWRVEDARENLLAKRLLLESLENRVAPPPVTLNVLTSFRGAVVGAPQKQSHNSICPRCGGDGGVNGGCDKCGGTGWI